MKIVGIATSRFHEILDSFLADGWEQTYIYAGMDAGIDYSEYHLRKGAETLKFVWDNWTEGEIEGSESVIAIIKTG